MQLLKEHDYMQAFWLAPSDQRELLPKTLLGQPIHFVDADDPENYRFCQHLRCCNAMLYESFLAMPEWVFVDCGLLPSGFIGLMVPAKKLAPGVRDRLDKFVFDIAVEKQGIFSALRYPDISAPLADDELVPISEYCFLPSFADKETAIGFSFSAIPLKGESGKKIPGVGTATKALALAALKEKGYIYQKGITQLDNSALRVHTLFGDLQLGCLFHTAHPGHGRSFVYKLTIPSDSELSEIADRSFLGQFPPVHGQAFKIHDLEALRKIDNQIKREGKLVKMTNPGYSAETQEIFLVID